MIGINAQIYSQSGGYQGLSFAIPIDVALKIKDQIVKTGEARHARLGVQIQDLDQALAASFGLPRPDGALVSQVDARQRGQQGRPEGGRRDHRDRWQAGVRSGVLSSRIGLSAPGEQVRLKVWRDKALAAIWMSSSAAPSSRATGRRLTADAGSGNQLGLALRPLSARTSAARPTSSRPTRAC